MKLNRCCFCFPLNGPGVLTIAIATTIVYGGVFIWLLVRHSVILDYFQGVSSIATPFLYLCIAISGLACLCNIFGIFSASQAQFQQRIKAMQIYSALYWFVAAIVLPVTFASWISLIVKRDDVVASCRLFANMVPDFDRSGPHDIYIGACEDSVKHLLIAGGFIVFVGNAAQIYLAMVLAAGALRLKEEPQNQQHQRQYNYPLQDRQYMPPPPVYYNNDNINSNYTSNKGPYY